MYLLLSDEINVSCLELLWVDLGSQINSGSSLHLGFGRKTSARLQLCAA